MKVSLLALSISISLPFCSQMSFATESTIFPVVNANTYQEGVDLQDYWVSEKLDGIRAIWTGSLLNTRSGKIIHAPKWFTDGLPDTPLDGELWAGKDRFFIVQSTVLDKLPNDVMWQSISYMVFDLPSVQGTYETRYMRLQPMVEALNKEHIKHVVHQPVGSEEALYTLLNQTTELGGEGLMLRKINSHNNKGRSNDLLKLKLSTDQEATVIGYKAGTGKYQGMMGSLLVKTAKGAEFYIGSGFSDKQRMEPPPIGATITFQFNGYTHKGIPKFARYVRERP